MGTDVLRSRLMARNRERKEKLAELVADLRNPRVLPLIDAAITEIYEDLLDHLSVRERAARRHKAPDPLPPAPQELIAVIAPKPVTPPPPEVRAPNIYTKRERQASPTSPVQALNLVSGSAAHTCWQIVEPRETGISYGLMREEFLKLHPAGTETSYTGAIQRLKSSGHLVTWKGRLWASHRRDKFMEDVAAGLAQDIEEQPKFHSAWQDAVLDLLRSHKGWMGVAQITQHVTRSPEFQDRKNPLTQVCTALRNLSYRHKLVERRGRGRGAEWRAVPAEGNEMEEEKTAGDLLSAVHAR